MLEKGAFIKVDPSPDQFLSNIFTIPKKDGGNRPVINLKKLDNFIHCPHFKMEGLSLVKEQLSPEDCICKVDLKDAYFFIPIHRNSQNLRFEWEGSLHQFICLFRVIARPIGVYKTTESCNSLAKKTECEADYLSRQYFTDASMKGRIRERERHIDFSITSRFRNQCEKVCTLLGKNHRIPWDYNKFDQNGIIPLRRESSKNSNAMSENIGPEISVCKGGLSVDRNIILNCPSSLTSSSPVSLPTETTNIRIKNFPFLRETNSIIHSKHSRDSMVGSLFEIKQWKVFSKDTPCKLECIKGRLGVYCQGERTGFP